MALKKKRALYRGIKRGRISLHYQLEAEIQEMQRAGWLFKRATMVPPCLRKPSTEITVAERNWQSLFVRIFYCSKSLCHTANQSPARIRVRKVQKVLGTAQSHIMPRTNAMVFLAPLHDASAATPVMNLHHPLLQAKSILGASRTWQEWQDECEHTNTV